MTPADRTALQVLGAALVLVGVIGLGVAIGPRGGWAFVWSVGAMVLGAWVLWRVR